MNPYKLRAIRFLQLWCVDDWRFKLYGIAYDRSEPRAELLAAAQRVAGHHLRSLPAGTHHYNVGYLGVHDGKTANFVFLDFWADENELHHHVFTSPSAQPEMLTNVTATGLSACAWDLRLQAFECEAWVTHVLQPAEPDFEAYLATRLNADI